MINSPFNNFRKLVEGAHPEIKPKKRRVYIEHIEQTHFFNWVKNYFPEDEKHGRFINGKFISPRLIFAIPNGGARPKKTYINRKGQKIVYSPEGKRLKEEGAKAGTYDIFVSVPASGYHGMYMETKAEGHDLSPEQKKFKTAGESQGYKCVMVRNHLEAKQELLNYLNG